MKRRESDVGWRIGSAKSAINTHGERILEGSPLVGKLQVQVDIPESSSKARELHLARKDMSRYKDSRRAAELTKTKAESELSAAKNTVNSLSSLIEESNWKVKAQMRDIETLKTTGRREQAVRSVESYQYAEVMRELEFVKQELSKLKLDVASVLEEKAQAEKEAEAARSKPWSNSGCVAALRKEIEEVNEEQVLVELARIEALKEFEEIQSQRVKEESEFSFAVEETRKKMKDVVEEIDRSKDVENKLAVTVSDVKVLESELRQVKEMDKRVQLQRNDVSKHSGGSFRWGEELELLSVTEELNAAKKELASIREEGFQFMASMDVIRSELKHVTEETARLKKAEEKGDSTVQTLNSKLLRAKSKLEATNSAAEQTKSIVSNLSLTLEQLKTEAEAAKKEKEIINRETAKVKAEIQKTESEIDVTEERLEVAMKELEAVKSSEAAALENLKILTKDAMRTRAHTSQHSSSITISKFEYEYLTGRAVAAEEIADKKVAASQAWIEALKASEKEILMKTEIAHREIREMRVEGEREVCRTERSLSVKRAVEGELRNCRHKREKKTEAENMNQAYPRKSMKGSANMTPSRRAKFRKSASPATPMSRSTSFTIRKRKKVMPNLAKLFSGKKVGKVL